MAQPTFGGVPDRVRPGDWLLVQWVATAKRGDPFPEPWCHAHAPLKTMVGLLVELGVIEPPPPDADVATIARESTAAAKLWLERHPQPPAAPQQVARRMTWGPLHGPLQQAGNAGDGAADADAAASMAAVRLAQAARQFVMRAEQLQLAMVVEHHYEVQTRTREPGGAVEYRRKFVRAMAMWRLNSAAPAHDGQRGLDPAFDLHYVTREREVRVSTARWDTGDSAGAATLRYSPTRAVDGLTQEQAKLLVDKMARTLASPQRYEQIGELEQRSADGPRVWLAPQSAELPPQGWTTTVPS